MKKLFYGSLYHLKAAGLLLRHGILWKYILLPWLLAILIFILFLVLYLYISIEYVPRWEQQLKTPGNIKALVVKILIKLNPKPLKSQQNPIQTILWIILAIVGILLFLLTQSILCKPFYQRLSCKVEEVLTGHVLLGKPAGYFSRLWKEVWGRFKDIPKYIGLGMALIFLSMLQNYCAAFQGSTNPLFSIIGKGIPLLCSGIFFMIGGYYTGISYYEYVLDRRKLEYELRKKKIRKNRWLTTGFGCVSMLILLLPGVNVLMIPLNIIAGTIVVVQEIDPRKATISGQKDSASVISDKKIGKKSPRKKQ